MIPPDGDVGDRRYVQACFPSQLRFGAVFIQPRHGEEPVARNLRRVIHGDEAVGVAGVAHNMDAHVARGVLLNRLALADKDLSVDAEQLFAFHAGLAGHAADQQSPVDAAEPFLKVGRRHDAFEQRKGAILQFHHHPLEGGQRGLDFEQVQNQGLVRPEHGPGSDAKQERITDLAGSSRHGDTNRCCAHSFHKSPKAASFGNRKGAGFGPAGVSYRYHHFVVHFV